MYYLPVYEEGSIIDSQTKTFCFFDKTKGKNVTVFVRNKVTHNEYGEGVIKDIRPAVDKTVHGLVAEIEFNGNKGHTKSFLVPEAFENQILELK